MSLFENVLEIPFQGIKYTIFIPLKAYENPQSDNFDFIQEYTLLNKINQNDIKACAESWHNLANDYDKDSINQGIQNYYRDIGEKIGQVVLVQFQDLPDFCKKIQLDLYNGKIVRFSEYNQLKELVVHFDKINYLEYESFDHFELDKYINQNPLSFFSLILPFEIDTLESLQNKSSQEVEGLKDEINQLFQHRLLCNDLITKLERKNTKLHNKFIQIAEKTKAYEEQNLQITESLNLQKEKRRRYKTSYKNAKQQLTKFKQNNPYENIPDDDLSSPVFNKNKQDDVKKFEMKKQLEKKELEKCELKVMLAQRDYEKSELKKENDRLKQKTQKLQSALNELDNVKVSQRRIITDRASEISALVDKLHTVQRKLDEADKRTFNQKNYLQGEEDKFKNAREKIETEKEFMETDKQTLIGKHEVEKKALQEKFENEKKFLKNQMCDKDRENSEMKKRWNESVQVLLASKKESSALNELNTSLANELNKSKVESHYSRQASLKSQGGNKNNLDNDGRMFQINENSGSKKSSVNQESEIINNKSFEDINRASDKNKNLSTLDQKNRSISNNKNSRGTSIEQSKNNIRQSSEKSSDKNLKKPDTTVPSKAVLPPSHNSKRTISEVSTQIKQIKDKFVDKEKKDTNENRFKIDPQNKEKVTKRGEETKGIQKIKDDIERAKITSMNKTNLGLQDAATLVTSNRSIKKTNDLNKDTENNVKPNAPNRANLEVGKSFDRSATVKQNPSGKTNQDNFERSSTLKQSQFSNPKEKDVSTEKPIQPPKQDTSVKSPGKPPAKKELEFMTNYKEFFESKTGDYVHHNRIRALKSHPTEKYLVSGDDDGRLVKWTYDEKDNATLSFIDFGILHSHRVQSILFLGPYIVTASHEGAMYFFDMNEHKVVLKEKLNGIVHSTCLSLLSDTLFVGVGNNLHQYGIKDNILIPSNLETNDNNNLTSSYVKIIWTPHTGNIMNIKNHPKDNSIIFTGSADGTLKKLNTDKKCIALNFGSMHGGKGITSISIDHNATKVITAGEDYEIVINNVETGEVVYRFSKICSNWIMDLRVSYCGRYVYTAGLDGQFREFDLVEQVESKNYGKIAVNLWSIAISQDGKYLWSGTFGGRIIQWKIKLCC